MPLVPGRSSNTPLLSIMGTSPKRAPQLARADHWFDMGPIIGVVH